MLLKPLSTNVFYAAIFVTVVLGVALALAQPVFGGVVASEGMHDWMRSVLVPMFQA